MASLPGSFFAFWNPQLRMDVGDFMFRRLKVKPARLLLAVVAVAGLGGAAALARSPHHPLTLLPTHTAVTPDSNPSPLATPEASDNPSPSPAPTALPAVAGASTAPTPAQTRTQTRVVNPATPTPSPRVTLIVTIGQASSSYLVELLSGANACTVLEEAKREGEISSVTITDKYASLKSLFVEEINGVSGWEYGVKNGSPPNGNIYGCTYAGSMQPIDGSIVTWKHQ